MDHKRKKYFLPEHFPANEVGSIWSNWSIYVYLTYTSVLNISIKTCCCFFNEHPEIYSMWEKAETAGIVHIEKSLGNKTNSKLFTYPVYLEALRNLAAAAYQNHTVVELGLKPVLYRA